MRTTIRRIAAVAAVAAGLVTAVAPAASAAAPVRLFAAPTFALSANATIAAVVTGLPANGTFWVGECGWVPTGCAGNPATATRTAPRSPRSWRRKSTSAISATGST
ncbi:hypothetical protein [Amycolatopsis sp. NPDC004378]